MFRWELKIFEGGNTCGDLEDSFGIPEFALLYFSQQGIVDSIHCFVDAAVSCGFTFGITPSHLRLTYR